MENVASYYPVGAQDLFNYLAGKYTLNSQLTCIMRLDGILDEQILRQAMRATLEVEPILGCDFRENEDRACWERRLDLDKLELCPVVERQDVEPVIWSFVCSPFDTERDCQVKAIIIRGESDSLCVKINHACADAGGLKGYIKLLVSIYNQLFANRQYPVVAQSHECRCQYQILQLPFVSEVIKSLQDDDVNNSETVSLCFRTGIQEQQTVVLDQLDSKAFNALKSYAVKHKATINDMLVTAYIRALAAVANLEEERIAVNVTVDLRRYLPPSQADVICNLSGVNLISSTGKTNSFAASLAKVLIETNKMKANHPGIKMALYIESLSQMSFKEADTYFQQLRDHFFAKRITNPWFSNVGLMSDRRFQLGSAAAVDCYMVGPATYAPGFMLLASTYENTLTLSANFFQSSIQKQTIEKLVSTMLADLEKCTEEI